VSYSSPETNYISALRHITVAIVKTEGGIGVKRQPHLRIAGYSRKKQKLCTLVNKSVRVLGISLKLKTETTANLNKAKNNYNFLTVGLEAATD